MLVWLIVIVVLAALVTADLLFHKGAIVNPIWAWLQVVYQTGEKYLAFILSFLTNGQKASAKRIALFSLIFLGGYVSFATNFAQLAWGVALAGIGAIIYLVGSLLETLKKPPTKAA
jgi:hypothetical protein